MASSLVVGPAPQKEWGAVAELLFQHVPAGARAARVAGLLRLLQQGEIEPDGMLAAHMAGKLHGGLVCVPLRGASALVWPPQAVPGPGQAAVVDGLVRHALDWLSGRGARLAQALLTTEEAFLAEPLGRHGFAHVTTLLYLRRVLTEAPTKLQEGRLARLPLQYQTYNQNPAHFQQTLVRTYEGTLDCPELNGVRDVADIIDGHQAQGNWDPERWWLAHQADEPVGVLLLTDMPDWQSWDVSYLGVVPEARARGVGRQLTAWAMQRACAAGIGQLTLAVDARNDPARRLYAGMGFDQFDHREVFLAVLEHAR
jgi:mycothiol synthase